MKKPALALEARCAVASPSKYIANANANNNKADSPVPDAPHDQLIPPWRWLISKGLNDLTAAFRMI